MAKVKSAEPRQRKFLFRLVSADGLETSVLSEAIVPKILRPIKGSQMMREYKLMRYLDISNEEEYEIQTIIYEEVL
jgi:hypothetical protein